MNTINLIGRIANDVTLQYSAKKDDTCWCKINIAVQRTKDITDFIPVVLFNKTAEIAGKYCKKGTKIGITGSLHQETYTNKENKKVTTYCVYASTLDLIEPKPQQPAEPQQTSEPNQANTARPNPADTYCAVEPDAYPFT